MPEKKRQPDPLKGMGHFFYRRFLETVDKLNGTEVSSTNVGQQVSLIQRALALGKEKRGEILKRKREQKELDRIANGGSPKKKKGRPKKDGIA